jgi:hypothetical protein
MFSSGTPVSSTNKTDRHDITEILLKVALNNINLNQTLNLRNLFDIFNKFKNMLKNKIVLRKTKMNHESGYRDLRFGLGLCCFLTLEGAVVVVW